MILLKMQQEHQSSKEYLKYDVFVCANYLEF